MDKIYDLFSEQTECGDESHGQFRGKQGVRKMYLQAVGGGQRTASQTEPTVEGRLGGTTIVQIGGVITLAQDGKPPGAGGIPG
jgi:hypothetical protein